MLTRRLLCLIFPLIVLIGCAPAAAITPVPSTVIPPTPPDICAETNNTYRLVPSAYFMDSNPTATTVVSASQSLTSPDGSYSVQQVANTLVLHPENGGSEITLESAAYESLTLAEYVHWSHDSQHVAIVEGEQFFSQLLAIRIYELNGDSVLLAAKLNDTAGFLGWSPDDAYLYGMPTLNNLTVWDWQTQRETATFEGWYIPQVEWSPDGEYIAYYWRTDDANVIPPHWGYAIAAADGTQETRFEVPVNSAYDGLGDGFAWSPDSQHIAFYYHEIDPFQPDPRIVVYQREGERVLSLSRSYMMKDNDLQLMPVSWSSDSTSLLIWQIQDTRYNLVNVSIGDGEEATALVSDVLRLPYDSPDGVRTAIYDQQDDLYSLTLMDNDGSNSVPFISDATDLGDPDWSADGALVAAVWATEDSEGRHIQLSWADASGENRHDFVGDYLDIRNLVWSPDNRYLLFVGITPTLEYRVEQLDFLTGEYRILRAGLSEVTELQYDVERQLFTFLWHSAGNQFGFAGYDGDGALAFDYLHSQRFREFPAPDGQTIAIKSWSLDGEMLLLANASRETQHTLATDLDGLGDPLWSPDGRLIAYTQWVNPGIVTLHVYTADGEKLWSTEYMWLWSPLEWEAC